MGVDTSAEFNFTNEEQSSLEDIRKEVSELVAGSVDEHTSGLDLLELFSRNLESGLVGSMEEVALHVIVDQGREEVGVSAASA